MPYKSPFVIDIPTGDLLTYLFSSPAIDADKPLWISASNPTISLSRNQALQWVRRLSTGLRNLRLETGDAVLMISPNHVFVPVAYIATVGYGSIFSGLSPASSVEEMIYQIKHIDAKMVLVHPSAAKNLNIALQSLKLTKTRVFFFSDVEIAEFEGIRDWRSTIGTADEAYNWPWQRLSHEESKTRIATINYSSGTTGLPKGVCVSHHNLIANVEQIIFMREYPERSNRHASERWLNILPLYHAFGQMFNILMACRLGLPNYIMEKFQYGQFLSHIQNYRITHVTTAPPILVMLSKRQETARYDISSLTEIVCGGAPLSKELQNDVSSRFNILVKQTWGGTELTCSATMTPNSITDENGSAGALLPNMECKLLADDGNEVETAEPGEAWMKGPNVCLGYWKNEAATSNAIDGNGFYRTGDIAVRDECGLFYVVDRKKEMIKVDGFQVAPAELEAILLNNEHIADAAVVGVKQNDNELPRAYVVLKAHAKAQIDESKIQHWLAERVPKYKRLRGGVIFIEHIPKSPSGKIQRKEIRKWVEGKHGEGNIKWKL